MKHSIKISALFTTMAVLLFGSIVGTYWMGVMTLNKSHEVQAQQVVIDRLQETLSTLKDAETGQRGYLLTGEAKYLAPYQAATARIPSQIDDLTQRAKAGELDADGVQSIAKLTDQKLAEIRETVELQKHGDTDAALRIVDSDAGIRIMDSIRDGIGRMANRQQLQLQEARRAAYIYTIIRSIVFFVVAFLNLAFLGWTYRKIVAEMTGRDVAAIEARRQKDLLAVTLSSIGDAVIVCDTTGQITFLNKVAERLTGWSAAESIGQPCASVFRIINESSRAVVESPVDKVLRLGSIVGLANHTLLIRKDGTEVPIDDSGAPIQEPDGTLRGVVLVFRDFSEYKEAERKLIEAKEELEVASTAKDQFLATLSHELRTPLTPVLATLTTWEASDELPAALLPDVQMLRRNMELEARLIDDLLDLTRIVKGKLLLSREVVDVHELIHAVAGMYHSEIQTKRIRLTMQLDAVRHNANLDPARFQQVCWNILKNATKFTPEAGTINIVTRNNDDGELMVTFTDSGIGMSEDTLSRLFRPFEQGTADMVRRYGGLGLGMAISKALVDAHQGSLTATSAGEGLGSAFTVSLPTSLASPQSPAPAHPDTLKEPGVTRRLRILLVEDHPDTALVMGKLLRRLGHEVETTDSVASASRALGGQAFDMILSDIGLPDGTGIELIRQIRERHKMPAIALTGFGMDDDIAKCREAGFDAHLTKPVNFQKLEMIIHQLANGAE